MNRFKDILDRNDLTALKYTIKGKSTIVNTPLGQFVLKEKKDNDIYKYLLSRNFNYFPKVIDSNDDITMYEYIDNVEYDEDEKAFDLIHYLALLHSKTSYYKEIDLDEFKNIYEKTYREIEYIYNYYLDIIKIIETKIYMSPSEYLIARNINKIFSCIFFCKRTLEDWYEIVKEKKRKRVATLHNNVDTNNLLKNKETYLIGWENNAVDMPIYDFVNFYKKRALDFDFPMLLKEYERIYPLLEEEKKLMFVLISIPEKLSLSNNEYNTVKKVRKFLDKIYKTEFMLTPEKEEESTSTD